MNKKIICIFLIFSLLTVSLGSIAANETTNDISSESATVSNEPTTATSTEDNNSTTENNTTENKTQDIVVPSTPVDLNIFYVVITMIDHYDLNAFASALEDVDSNTYSEVISALRSHDKMKVLSLVGKLSPNKIDEFFYIFMGIYEDYYTPEIEEEDDVEESDDDSIVSKTMKVLTGNYKNSKVNKYTNNYNNYGNNANEQVINKNNQNTQTVKENKTAEKSIQKNHNKVNTKKYFEENYELNGKVYHTMYDYVNALISAYESGEISYDYFISVLDKYHFDTEDMKVGENGEIEWDYIHINSPSNMNNTQNSTNITDLNDTNITNATNITNETNESMISY